MNQQSLSNKMRILLNKPITLWELARLVESRRHNCDIHNVREKIQYWIDSGFYGIKLHAWQAPGSQMTTLRNYQDFRQKVALQRKKCVKALLKHNRERRLEEFKRTPLPFPASQSRFASSQN